MEAPQVGAGPAVTGLYFVGSQQASQSPHPPGYVLQVGGWRGPDSIGCEGRINVHGGQATIAERAGGAVDMSGVPLGPSVPLSPGSAAVAVGRRDRGAMRTPLSLGPPPR